MGVLKKIGERKINTTVKGVSAAAAVCYFTFSAYPRADYNIEKVPYVVAQDIKHAGPVVAEYTGQVYTAAKNGIEGLWHDTPVDALGNSSGPDNSGARDGGGSSSVQYPERGEGWNHFLRTDFGMSASAANACVRQHHLANVALKFGHGYTNPC